MVTLPRYVDDLDIAPTGEIVVTARQADGGAIVTRLLPDGSPDTTFAGDGTLELAAESNLSKAWSTVLADGSIVVTRAYQNHVSQPGLEYDWWSYTAQPFSSGGAPFGNLIGVSGNPQQPDDPGMVAFGDGVLVPGQTLKQYTADLTLVKQVNREAYSGIRVDGSGRVYGRTIDVRDNALPYEGTIWRLQPDLSLDTSYGGGDGVVDVVAEIAAAGGPVGNRTALWLFEVDPAGSVTFVADVENTPPCFCPKETLGIVLGRLTPDGARDPGLAGDGTTTILPGTNTWTAQLNLLADGRLTLHHSGAIWAFTSAGAVDTSFSSDGKVEIASSFSEPSPTGHRLYVLSYAGSSSVHELRALRLSG